MFGARQCSTARVRHKLESAALHIQASSCFNRTLPLSAQVSQILSPPDEPPRPLAYSCTSPDMASSSGCCPTDKGQHDNALGRASACEEQSDTTQPIETNVASKRPSSRCSIPTAGESANRRKESWFGQRVWTNPPPPATCQETIAMSAGQVPGVKDTAGSSHTSPQPQGWAFSVMCYNILADTYAHRFASKLYRDVPKACLEWPARRALLLEEIRHWAPDVVCLQEVQHFQDLEPEMRAAGYEGHFMRRGGRRRDGCAMFWRADRLRACAVQRLDYLSLGLDDNVAMLLSLAPRAGADCDSSLAALLSSVRLMVATVHVSFDPAKGEVKLAQVRTLLGQAAQLAAHPPPEEATARGAAQPPAPAPASPPPSQRNSSRNPGVSTAPLPFPTFKPDDPRNSLLSAGCQTSPHLPVSLSVPSQLYADQAAAGQGLQSKSQSQPQLQLPAQTQTQPAGSDATGERHRHKSPPRAAVSATGAGDGSGSGAGGVSSPVKFQTAVQSRPQPQLIATASQQQQPQHTLAIITGDFNSTAGSPLYQYVAGGALDLSTTSRKKLSGQLHGVCHAQYKPVSEVKQLHAQITAAAAAAASDAGAATAAAASASPAAVDATAASPPATPRETSSTAAATAAALAAVTSARDVATAAVANVCAAAAVAAAHPPTAPPATRASVASRMLEGFLSAFGRSSSEGWTERELRCALGDQYTHPNHQPQRPKQQLSASSSQVQPQHQLPANDGAQGLNEADTFAQQPPSQQQEARWEVTSSSSCGGVGGNGGEEAVGRRTRRSMSQPLSNRHSLDNGPGVGGGGGGASGGNRRSMDSQPPGEASSWPECGTQAVSGRLVARHPLQLRSAYMEVARAEPAFTSIHSGFMGTVDFIWYTKDSIVQQSGAGIAHPRQGIDAGAATSSTPSHGRLPGAPAASVQCGTGAGSAVTSAKEATGAVPAGVCRDRGSSCAAAESPATDVSNVNSETSDSLAMEGAAPRFSLVPVAVLQPPDLDALPLGLPATGWGSDHISIMTRFELRPVVSLR